MRACYTRLDSKYSTSKKCAFCDRTYRTNTAQLALEKREQGLTARAFGHRDFVEQVNLAFFGADIAALLQILDHATDHLA